MEDDLEPPLERAALEEKEVEPTEAQELGMTDAQEIIFAEDDESDDDEDVSYESVREQVASGNGSASAIPPRPERDHGSTVNELGASSSSIDEGTQTKETTAAPETLGRATGIVVTGMRRRPAAAILRRQKSSLESTSGEDDDDAVASTPYRPSTRKNYMRAPSLKHVASSVKSNLRSAQSGTWEAIRLEDDPIPASSPTSTSATSDGFAGVAAQVVNSQRAARGIRDLWQKGPSAQQYYKGIHMEKKKLELNRVTAEYKEVKRQQFYQELLVYLIFLSLFFSLLGWLPVQDSFEQNDVVGFLTCREQGVCQLNSIEDTYAFSETLADRICHKSAADAQWIRVGDVRFRQVRVQETKCQIYGDWYEPCYPPYAFELEEKGIIYAGNGTRSYHYEEDLGPLQTRPYNSIFNAHTPVEYFGRGGYAVDLCQTNIDTLMEDAWLSKPTRAFSIDFTLLNPVTRVFTIGSHVFKIDASGHLEHFPHSSHLRVVGLEEPHYGHEVHDSMMSIFDSFDYRMLLWLALMLFVIAYCIGEVSLMVTMGVETYLQSDMWNVFELTHLTLLTYLLFDLVCYYMASLRFASHLEAVLNSHKTSGEDYDTKQELLTTFQHIADLASVSSAMCLLKVFKFLRMNSTLSLIWRVLGAASRDLMGFLVIFNLIFVGYAAMGSYAFGFALAEFATISDSYATCFQMLAGDVDYPRLRQANPRIAPLFISTFIVLVFQILVNMFVAILSEYYESAKGGDEAGEDVEYDVLARIRDYLESCSPTVVVPRSEVIRLEPGDYVRLISTNLVDKEATRQRARKLFRGAVWRILALLRFGMKFDRRIQFGDRKMHHDAQYTNRQDNMVPHIPLSENFNHKTIKEIVPIGIRVQLQGTTVMGHALTLEVVKHSKLSVECRVLEPGEDQRPRWTRLPSAESFEESDGESRDASALELIGGEKLRVPWQILALHLGGVFLKELRTGVLRAMKLWNYSKKRLVDEYHLRLLFENALAEGQTSLRLDEVSRMLDMYLRKDRKKRLVSRAAVRKEALQVMYRFRNCLIDMPSREKEGHNYNPKPVDTSRITLGQLEYVAEVMAENVHDGWARERLKQGWTWGASRSDEEKKHPNLVPYDRLAPYEQSFDYRSIQETLKCILYLNYSIAKQSKTGSQHSFARSNSAMSDDSESTPSSGGGSSPKVGNTKKVPSMRRDALKYRRSSIMEDSPYSTVYGEDENVYQPKPIDTSSVELPATLTHLVDLLAENAHEVWARGRMDDGWTYGPQRDDKNKKHPCLVPYIFLTDEEKEYDISIASETLKTLIAMHFTIVHRSNLK